VADALRHRFFDALRGPRRPASGCGTADSHAGKDSEELAARSILARSFRRRGFIYLYRDPRQVLSSMIEAWTSGRFQTYPQLPGWTGPAWSLLLVPGWRAFIGRPLHEIVAAQVGNCDTVPDR
jgi:hypothetical protein